MLRDEFEKLPAISRFWLRADYARGAGRVKYGAALITALALVFVGLQLAGAIAIVALGQAERHQVRLGSPEEERLSAYVDMAGFGSYQSYERYARAAREAGLGSAWVPSKVASAWLEAGLPVAAREAIAKGAPSAGEPPSAAYYEKMASEWAKYKSGVRRAAGPVKRCSTAAALVAGLPWSAPAEQEGACQAVGYQGWVYMTLVGGLFFGGAFFFLVVVRGCWGCKRPAWGVLEWPAARTRAFEAWLGAEGEAGMARLERARLARVSGRLLGSKRAGRSSGRI